MITLNLYKYEGRADTVNKDLGTSSVMLGVVRDDIDLLNPRLRVRYEGDLMEYNYCYIPELKRYYYIDQVDVLSSDEYTIYLVVDVLKSYQSQIIGATGRVIQSDTADKYSSNREIVYSKIPNFEKISFPNTNLLNSEGNIIMVSIKGK